MFPHGQRHFQHIVLRWQLFMNHSAERNHKHVQVFAPTSIVPISNVNETYKLFQSHQKESLLFFHVELLWHATVVICNWGKVQSKEELLSKSVGLHDRVVEESNLFHVGLVSLHTVYTTYLTTFGFMCNSRILCNKVTFIVCTRSPNLMTWKVANLPFCILVSLM